MSGLREIVAGALLNAKIEGAIRIDQECESSHRACAPILCIDYDQMTDAIMQAIAKDAVIVEKARWERVSNAVRSFKQAEEEDANMDDAVYCHVCMDAVQLTDLDPLP